MKISPTAAKKARCLRGWASDRLAGFRKKKSYSAGLGSEIHNVAENWLQTRVSPDTTTPAGKAFHRVIPHLDLMQGQEFTTEKKVEVEFEGIVFRGYADFFSPQLYGDWKSSSNPKAYSLTEEGLLKDEQFNIYGLWWLDEFDLIEGDGAWIYIPTKSGKPIIRRQTAKLSRVEDYFGEVLMPRALDMIEIGHDWTYGRSIRHLNMLPHNPKACEYSGLFCDFFPHCDMYSRRKELDMSRLQERLAAKKAEKEAADLDNKEAASQAVKENEVGGVPPEAPVDDIVAEVNGAIEETTIAPKRGRKKATKKKGGRSAEASQSDSKIEALQNEILDRILENLVTFFSENGLKVKVSFEVAEK